MIGILAYGSLRTDPGGELASAIVDRQPVETPFPVEFARYSRTRGGAPTLVPVLDGYRVRAEVLILREAITIGDAESMLWRREIRREGFGDVYVRPSQPGCNSVLIETLQVFANVRPVLYTNFPPEGKLKAPHPKVLAEAAVKSAAEARPGEDGISYLIKAKAAGLQTRLTPSYEAEILCLTGAPNLHKALEVARQGAPDHEEAAQPNGCTGTLGVPVSRKAIRRLLDG